MTQLDFAVGPELEATGPPEARGLDRDSVRLMVASRSAGDIVHADFRQLPDFLRAGDVVVINNSATVPAAVDALSAAGTKVVVHFSTQLSRDLWVVEPRQPAGGATRQWSGELPPRELHLADGGLVEFQEPYLHSTRLWVARASLPDEPLSWLARNGRPIRYDYVERDWPIDAYQNVYALYPGSAEMPSAGRPITPAVITAMVAKGIAVAPVTLHAGVSSLEAKELPFPERVVVPHSTAVQVNAARAGGGRVIAIGTTVVRALESAAADDAAIAEVNGWTDLVVTPDRGTRIVDGILTGWHEPEASHLLMLEAIAGAELLRRSYREGVAAGYRWHEFGDSHLILP